MHLHRMKMPALHSQGIEMSALIQHNADACIAFLRKEHASTQFQEKKKTSSFHSQEIEIFTMLLTPSSGASADELRLPGLYWAETTPLSFPPETGHASYRT